MNQTLPNTPEGHASFALNENCCCIGATASLLQSLYERHLLPHHLGKGVRDSGTYPSKGGPALPQMPIPPRSTVRKCITVIFVLRNYGLCLARSDNARERLLGRRKATTQSQRSDSLDAEASPTGSPLGARRPKEGLRSRHEARDRGSSPSDRHRYIRKGP